MKHTLLTFFTVLLLAPLAAPNVAVPPAVCWTFDEARDTGAVQQARERMDSVQGAIEFAPGMTGKPANELAVLARSWNFPAELKLAGSAFESLGYDKNQRAYVLARKAEVENASLDFTLASNSQSPVLNPAFIVNNWGDANVTLTLDGKPIARGRDFRCGHRPTLEGTGLIVWIETESQASLTFHLEPQPQP